MARSYDPELYEFDRAIYNQYAEFDREMGLLESHMESGWWGESPPGATPGKTFSPGESKELDNLMKKAHWGDHQRNKLADFIFHKLHPERRGAALKLNEKALVDQWLVIHQGVEDAIEFARTNPATNTTYMGRLRILIEDLIRRHSGRP